MHVRKEIKVQAHAYLVTLNMVYVQHRGQNVCRMSNVNLLCVLLLSQRMCIVISCALMHCACIVELSSDCEQYYVSRNANCVLYGCRRSSCVLWEIKMQNDYSVNFFTVTLKICHQLFT